MMNGVYCHTAFPDLMVPPPLLVAKVMRIHRTLGVSSDHQILTCDVDGACEVIKHAMHTPALQSKIWGNGVTGSTPCRI